MKKFTTYDEIEALCEAMIKDFFRSKHYTNMFYVDIEAFVREYLRIPIVFELFAEPDPGRIGFFSDGKRSLWVLRDGKRIQVTFPKNTAVIEKCLLSTKESGRRRFTIAHEGAHLIMSRHIPAQITDAFHSQYNDGIDYTPALLHEMLSVNEAFTNRAAACLLMPRFLVMRALKKFNGDKKIVAYDNLILAQREKLTIQKMADAMGTSYTAFLNRLKELDLLDYHPIEEYIREGLAVGGDIC